jgi:hypothetical protein
MENLADWAWSILIEGIRVGEIGGIGLQLLVITAILIDYSYPFE